MNQAPQKKGFDPSVIIGQVLQHLKYWRLGLILFSVGLLGGTVFLTFSRPLYSSRAVIHVDVYEYIAAEGSPEFFGLRRGRGPEVTLALRRVRSNLGTRNMIADAAAHLGIVRPGSSYEYIRDTFLPRSRTSILDSNVMQIEVFAVSPEIVREFPQALIDVYNAEQKRRAEHFREVHVARYLEEIEQLKQRVGERFDRRADFQDQNQLVNLMIERQTLERVPTDILRAKATLEQFEAVRHTMGNRAGNGGLSPLEELSLLTSVDNLTALDVGQFLPDPGISNLGPGALRAGAPAGDSPRETSPSVVIQPPMVDSLEPWRALERERRELEKEMQEAARRFGPEHRTMRRMALRMEQIDASLAAELAANRERFELREQALREKLATLEEQLPRYHQVNRDYESLRQEFQLMEDGQDVWDRAHATLATRLAAIDFGEDKERVELTLQGFTALRDVNPFSPNKQKLFIMSLVFGVGLAVGVPFVLERFNDTTSMLVEVEKATGLNAVGIVPLVERGLLESVVRSPELDKKVPKHLLENFRVIRANIALNPNQTAKSQVIMVTSSRSSEGKTTMSANLAWAFDSVAERTLLIDADTRRGRVHEVLNVPNDRGMSLLLHGRASVEDSIQSTELPHLDVITRGPILAGSSEFLCKPVFDQLVERWRGEYDRIIIDTPPMLGLSEGTSLQRVVDGVLLVVRAESTPKKDIRDAVTMLAKSGAHLFGFVMNRVDLRKLGNYYAYYYYSPRYYDSLEPAEDDPDPRETYPRGYVAG